MKYGVWKTINQLREMVAKTKKKYIKYQIGIKLRIIKYALNIKLPG